MKCKNCEHVFSDVNLKYCDQIDCCCLCLDTPPVSKFKKENECKHLSELFKYHGDHSIEKNADGNYDLSFCDDERYFKILEHIRFCPFCGDELK